MSLIRKVTRSVSAPLLAGTYRAASRVSATTAFRFAAWANRQAAKYPRSVRFPTASALWISNGYGEVLCSPFDWVGVTIAGSQTWEPTITRTVQALLNPDDVFVDIGAHVGHFSLAASAAVGPNGLVVAVEALPANLSALAEMVLRNQLSNVTVLGCAVSDRAGLAHLHAGGGGNLGQSSFRAVSDRRYPVLCGRLDMLLPPELWDRVKLLKIDIEGAEFDAITGLQTLLSRKLCPYLLCEVTDTYLRESGASASQLVDRMRQMGYQPFWTHKQSDVPWSPLVEAFSFDRQIDVLFVAPGHAVEAANRI